jgi:hypothetical protein
VLPTDPKNRQQLADWLQRRQELLKLDGKPADTPLTAREYLMVQRLQAARPAYSIA